ncbi:MAG: NUDIX domain-containing protein [Propionicimonas sp.]
MEIVPAASAIIVDDQRRVLLVKRGHEPQKGRWSVPGGSCEPGETFAEAAAREAFEETGLRVAIGEELWVVMLPGGPGRSYETHDFAATVIGGGLRPGDDADDARWVSDADLDRMPLTTDLADYLRRAGVFDPPGP